MSHKQPSEKHSQNRKHYWRLCVFQILLMLITYIFIILFQDSSKYILGLFVNETDQLQSNLLSDYGPAVIMGILYAGWDTIIRSKKMDAAQLDDAVTWLLGACSASLFSIATWSISALGAENANSNLWYIAILTIIWTVISSITFTAHKMALFDEGKGL